MQNTECSIDGQLHVWCYDEDLRKGKDKIRGEGPEERREFDFESGQNYAADANVSARNKSDWCGGHSRSRAAGQVRWQREGVTTLELRGEGVCRYRSEVGRTV